jgi:hypothetical protein
MNQAVVEINRIRIMLTERPASDVQDVFDYHEGFSLEEKKDYKVVLRIAVWVNYQSLKSTRRNIPVYLFWKKIRYWKFSVKYLAGRVAPHVLFSNQSIIMDLDGLSKKKVEAEMMMETENESPDSRQNS